MMVLYVPDDKIVLLREKRYLTAIKNVFNSDQVTPNISPSNAKPSP